jgi:hypothetical protein
LRNSSPGKIRRCSSFGIVPASAETIRSSLPVNEAIHIAQMEETLYVFFYLWYLLMRFTRLFGEG